MKNYTMPQTAEDGGGCTMRPSFSRDEYVVAMAYVPWQYFTNVYEPDKALETGTIFPELDKPFLRGGRGCRQ